MHRPLPHPYDRLLLAGPAVLLVLVALAPAPLTVFATFDAPKGFVLALGALLLAAATAVLTGSPDRGATDPVRLRLPSALLLAGPAAVAAALLALRQGSLAGPTIAVSAVTLALLCAQVRDGPAAVRGLARGASVAAALAGLYALLQVAGLDPTPWGPRREVVSTFGNTSFAAEFQAAALPLALLLALDPGSGRRDRGLGVGAALLAAAHLVMAVSRIDLLAAAAGLGVAVILVLHGRGRRRAALGLLVTGGAAAAFAAWAFLAAARGHGPEWVGRSDTLAVRVHVWQGALDLLAGAPLSVRGMPFVDLYPTVRTAAEYQISLGRVVGTAHDDLLEIAVTHGPVFALAALCTLAVVVVRLVRGVGREDALLRAALLGSLAATVVSALASSPLTHPASALLPALVAGASFALLPALRPGPGSTLSLRAAAAGAALLLVPLAWCAFGAVRADAFLALARGSLREGRTADSLVLYDAAAAADPRAFAPRFELGALLRSTGDPRAADQALLAAAEIRGNDMACRAERIYVLRDLGRIDDALALADESVALCPWHPLLLGARAALLLRTDDCEAALVDLEAAARLMPGNPRVAAMQAEARLGAAPSPETREAALDALAALLDDGDTRRFEGFTLAMLERDPPLLLPLVVRARRIVRRDPETAAALVLAAVPVAVEDEGFLADAADTLARAGRADLAKRVWGRAWAVRAERALDQGLAQEALEMAREATARDPRTASFLLTARILARLGQREAAVEAVGRALAVGTFHPDAIRRDTDLSALLPHADLEELMRRAELRLE